MDEFVKNWTICKNILLLYRGWTRPDKRQSSSGLLGRSSNAKTDSNSKRLRTDEPTVGPTDTARCRVACPRLKRMSEFVKSWTICQYIFLLCKGWVRIGRLRRKGRSWTIFEIFPFSIEFKTKWTNLSKVEQFVEVYSFIMAERGFVEIVEILPYSIYVYRGWEGMDKFVKS